MYIKRCKYILSFLLFIIIIGGCGKTEKIYNCSQILCNIEKLHSGDAKFYGDFIVTNVNDAMHFYNQKGELVKSYNEIHANWIDCDYEHRIIVYSNTDKQVGIVQFDEKFNIIRNNIVKQCHNLNIDPTICYSVDNGYYITTTEIKGNINNEDKNKENGIYTVKLYKTKDLIYLSFITDIVSKKANIEDGDLNYYNQRLYFTYEEEKIDKGNSAICLIVSKDSKGVLWSKQKELLKATSDHEPAVFKENKEKGFTLYYSCDKDNPGETYNGAKVYRAEYNNKLQLIEKDILILTKTKKGMLLYDVIIEKRHILFLYARNYLTDCDLIVEKYNCRTNDN